MPYLIQLLFGATILLLAGVVVCALLHKVAASLRHRVWAFTLLGVLLLPVLSPMVPTTLYLPIQDGRQQTADGSRVGDSGQQTVVKNDVELSNVKSENQAATPLHSLPSAVCRLPSPSCSPLGSSALPHCFSISFSRFSLSEGCWYHWTM